MPSTYCLKSQPSTLPRKSLAICQIARCNSARSCSLVIFKFFVAVSFDIKLFLDIFLMTTSTCCAVIRCHAEVRLLRNDNKVFKEWLELQTLRVCLQCSHEFLCVLIRSRISRAGMIDQDHKLLGKK